MGCDGGTIPKRDELVKTKKKPEQKDKVAEASFRWQHCALSQVPLQQPVVACEMGRIYNKDSIIEALLNKASAESAPVNSATVSHIKSLKDVKTLNLTENPAWLDSHQKGDGYNDTNKAQWICPISGLEMNGNFRFVFIWTCGCVLSEKAQKEITSNECLKCQKSFTAADVILLNPVEEDEIAIIRNKMESRRAKARDAKKSKKGAKEPVASSSVAVSTIAEVKSTVNGTAPASTPKPKLKMEVVTPRESLGKRSAGKLVDSRVPDPKLSKISGTYSVAKDPKASATYKSLFTSSEAATTQNRAHWVTYNPFYN